MLDTLDAWSLWDDTLVILVTDHGHYLGEKDIWGKPGAPLYQPMAHIPLLMAAPGVGARDCDALTTSVDLHATLQAVFGLPAARQALPRRFAPAFAHRRGGGGARSRPGWGVGPRGASDRA